jgi:hypothetical protein
VTEGRDEELRRQERIVTPGIEDDRRRGAGERIGEDVHAGTLSFE